MIVVVVAVVGMVVVVARLPLKTTISQSLQNFPTFPLIYCIMSFNKFLSTLFFNGNLSGTKNNNIISAKKFYLIGDEQCYRDLPSIRRNLTYFSKWRLVLPTLISKTDTVYTV